MILQSFRDQDINLEDPIDPISVATAIGVIPQLIDKVEISPTVHFFDPRTNKCTIRWNLFVLGTNRMYLGDTSHNNIADAVAAIRSGTTVDNDNNIKNMTVSPLKIAKFVSQILLKHEDGYIKWDDGMSPTYPVPPLGTNSINSMFSPGTSMYRLGLQSP